MPTNKNASIHCQALDKCLLQIATETAIIQGLQYISDYSDEKLQENKLKGNPQTSVAIPMICFCDIPLLRIEDHCKKYILGYIKDRKIDNTFFL